MKIDAPSGPYMAPWSTYPLASMDCSAAMKDGKISAASCGPPFICLYFVRATLETKMLGGSLRGASGD